MWSAITYSKWELLQFVILQSKARFRESNKCFQECFEHIKADDRSGGSNQQQPWEINGCGQSPNNYYRSCWYIRTSVGSCIEVYSKINTNSIKKWFDLSHLTNICHNDARFDIIWTTSKPDHRYAGTLLVLYFEITLYLVTGNIARPSRSLDLTSFDFFHVGCTRITYHEQLRDWVNELNICVYTVNWIDLF